ncbi:hypothetical protein [Candidatus Cardinium hertigii]|nr:hypothetical protein [Candidatus Cardinium hertigii]
MDPRKNWQDKLLYQAKTNALITRFWKNATRFHFEATVQMADPTCLL